MDLVEDMDDQIDQYYANLVDYHRLNPMEDIGSERIFKQRLTIRFFFGPPQNDSPPPLPQVTNIPKISQFSPFFSLLSLSHPPPLFSPFWFNILGGGEVRFAHKNLGGARALLAPPR